MRAAVRYPVRQQAGKLGEEMASSPLGDKRLCRLINRKIHTNVIVKKTRIMFSKDCNLMNEKLDEYLSVHFRYQPKTPASRPPFPRSLHSKKKTSDVSASNRGDDDRRIVGSKVDLREAVPTRPPADS